MNSTIATRVPGLLQIRRRVAVCLMLGLMLGMIALVGCGGGGSTGTYYHQGDPANPALGGITLELRSGNKARVTISGPGGQSLPPTEGTWSQEGNKITTVLDGHADVYTLEGDTLTTRAFGENIVFKKR